MKAENAVLSVEEFGSVVLDTVSALGESPDENAVKTLMSDLATLCIVQGLCAVADMPGAHDDKKTDMREALREGQKRWELATVVCQTKGVDLSSLGMAAVLIEAFDDDEAMQEAIAAFIREDYVQELSKALASSEPAVPTGIEELPENRELLDEFFKVFIKLGEFHRNRDAYESDEKRNLHDRLMALFAKIMTANPATPPSIL